MDVAEIRLANLRLLTDQLLEQGKNKQQAAAALDLSRSFHSQLVGGKKMGDDVARKIEVAAKLQRGWMDVLQPAAGARIGEPATVSYLSSQPAGRGELSLDIAGDAADDVAEYLGIDRSSRQYLALFQKIHQRVQSALESQVPANRLDFVVKPAARTTEETSNAERGPAEEVGARAGGGHQGAAAGKPGAKPRRKP